MRKKDKAEKLFVACTDVFVELVNVLLYQGEQILREEVMLPGPTESIYGGEDGEQCSQFRDYSMYEMRDGKVCALYNLENQSCIDHRMPLRCAGYDGAAYRRQYKNSMGQGIYPVITLVLNWGEKPWNGAVTISELLDYPVPEKIEQYIDQKQIKVFDMRCLEQGVRERFAGDVRVVLDYLTDRPSLRRRNQRLRNPQEVLLMLHALSGDDRYLEIAFEEEKGEITMCDLLDEYENRGLIRGMIAAGKAFGVSFEETAKKLKENFVLDDAEVQQNMKLYW